MIPYDLDFPRVSAVLLIFVMWMTYGPILTLLGRGTLNAQLHVVRLRWMRMLMARPTDDQRNATLHSWD